MSLSWSIQISSLTHVYTNHCEMLVVLSLIDARNVATPRSKELIVSIEYETIIIPFMDS